MNTLERERRRAKQIVEEKFPKKRPPLKKSIASEFAKWNESVLEDIKVQTEDLEALTTPGARAESPVTPKFLSTPFNFLPSTCKKILIEKKKEMDNIAYDRKVALVKKVNTKWKNMVVKNRRNPAKNKLIIKTRIGIKKSTMRCNTAPVTPKGRKRKSPRAPFGSPSSLDPFRSKNRKRKASWSGPSPKGLKIPKTPYEKEKFLKGKGFGLNIKNLEKLVLNKSNSSSNIRKFKRKR